MKKYFLLIVTTLFSASLFVSAEGMRKIDTDFDSLDNNDDGYVSEEEADDNHVWDHFKKIDTNSDRRLSEAEFKSYTRSYPSTVEEGEEIPARK
jgi:Ca2+-binding EF-hand superfamily protein